MYSDRFYKTNLVRRLKGNPPYREYSFKNGHRIATPTIVFNNTQRRATLGLLLYCLYMVFVSFCRDDSVFNIQLADSCVSCIKGIERVAVIPCVVNGVPLTVFLNH